MIKRKIRKTFETIDELNNSDEFKARWAGFVIRPEKDSPDCRFVKAFVTTDNKIFILREMKGGSDDGMKLLKEFNVTSMINNRPFFPGWVKDGEITIDDSEGYGRENNVRITFAKLHKDNPHMFAIVL